MSHIFDPLLDAAGIPDQQAGRFVADALNDMDDGELYLQYAQSEDLVFDDGRMKSTSFDTAQGFGLRAVKGEVTAYAHSSIFTPESLKAAAETVQAAKTGQGGVRDLRPQRPGKSLYMEKNPIEGYPFADKVKLLQKMDAYARKLSNQIQQVSLSLSADWQAIEIIRADGYRVQDIRPLVQLYVSIVTSDGKRQEVGSHGMGGRYGYEGLFRDETWQGCIKEALRSASVKLEARAAPAGELPVVLGGGWCGILLHEAVGHGLEGDFNRKGISNFSGLMGEQVAAKGVTVVDDGTLPHRRGSLTIDDEGTPSQKNVLIEDGRLVGYMQDRLNGRLMGSHSSGNGRRQSYAHVPMPRMTNTYMLGGEMPREELIAAVDRGIYAVDFGMSQVDITSGRFVISATEAYMIENGKITYPIKKCTLIGNGPDIMRKIKLVGNDMSLDDGIGTCGKDGQSVPVGVGQPSVLIEGMTVGGA